MLEAVARLAGSALIFAGWAVFGWALAARTGLEARATRWLASFVLAAWVSTCSFLILAFLRWVSLPSLLSVSTLAAAAALGLYRQARGPVSARALLRQDLRAILEAVRSLNRFVVMVLITVAVVHLVLAAASATSPLLGWDSLHYHLVHVAYWAQEGGFDAHPGVDAWGYYEYFPIGGEILWAWLTIPTRSTVLLGTAGVVLSGVGWLATYVSARAIGATRERSALCGAALVCTPAMLMFATNGYVDNTVLVYVACGVAFLFSAAQCRDFRQSQSQGQRLLILSGAALGLAVGVKTTAVGFLVVGALAACVLLMIRRAGARRAFGSLLAFGVAASSFVPRLVNVWAETGSPLYPFPLTLFGKVLSVGNQQLASLIEARTLPNPQEPPSRDLLLGLFSGGMLPEWPHVNLGWGGAGLLVLAAIGLGHWLLRNPRDLRWLLLLALIASAISFFVGSATLGYRVFWWWVIGRFMLPGLLGVVLLAAVAPGRWVSVVLGVVAVVGASWPLHWGMCGYRWLGAGCVLLAVSLVLALFAVARRSRKRAVAWLVAGLGSLSCALVALALRTQRSTLIHSGAMRGLCYEGHPFANGVIVGAFPIWDRLAEMPAQRIAVVAGFDGIGHGVFRYPLLGAHWQHRMFYVPPSADGKLRNHSELYGGPNFPLLSFESWARRLEQARIDYVVVIQPFNVIEYRWLLEHKERFFLEEVGRNGIELLFRVLPSTGTVHSSGSRAEGEGSSVRTTDA